MTPKQRIEVIRKNFLDSRGFDDPEEVVGFLLILLDEAIFVVRDMSQNPLPLWRAQDFLKKLEGE